MVDPVGWAHTWLNQQQGPALFWRGSFWVGNLLGGFDRRSPECVRHEVVVLAGPILSAAQQAMPFDLGDKAERYLRDYCWHDATAESPFRLDGQPVGRLIAFNNGRLSVDRYVLGFDAFEASYDPQLFCSAVLPFDYDPAATCPRWLDWLQWFTGGDQQVIDMLQEFAGSCLLPSMKIDRILWLVGDGSTGKSTFVRVLTKVLGEQAVSSLPPNKLASNHVNAALVGRCLNVAVEFSELSNRAIDALKAFTSQELLTVNPKYQQPFAFRPAVRLLLVSNGTPHIGDRSTGIWRRCLLLRCTQVVAGGLHNFADQLVREEASGILQWMLAGLLRVVQSGDISVPASVQADVHELRDHMDYTRAWIEESLVRTDRSDAFLPLEDVVYRVYVERMQRRRHKPVSYDTFKVVFKAVFPDLKADRRRVKAVSIYGGVGDNRRYGYVGIAWKNVEEAHEDLRNSLVQQVAGSVTKELADTAINKTMARIEQRQAQEIARVEHEKERVINPLPPKDTDSPVPLVQDVSPVEVDELSSFDDLLKEMADAAEKLEGE